MGSGSIIETNQMSIISCYCTFKESTGSNILNLYYCLGGVNETDKACITSVKDTDKACLTNASVSGTGQACISGIHDTGKVRYHLWVFTGL
jgi:hypothetical protein